MGLGALGGIAALARNNGAAAGHEAANPGPPAH
jgi:hypothetical protein